MLEVDSQPFKIDLDTVDPKLFVVTVRCEKYSAILGLSVHFSNAYQAQ